MIVMYTVIKFISQWDFSRKEKRQRIQSDRPRAVIRNSHCYE